MKKKTTVSALGVFNKAMTFLYLPKSVLHEAKRKKSRKVQGSDSRNMGDKAASVRQVWEMDTGGTVA